MTPVDRFLEHLDHVRRSGSGWTARCPAHEDRTPSLAVAEGEDGRALVKCFAGCPTERVLAELGLAWADLHDNVDDHLRVRPKPRRTSAPVTRADADYFGPGGEPRKLRAPLGRVDFDSDEHHTAYEAWRLSEGRLPPGSSTRGSL